MTNKVNAETPTLNAVKSADISIPEKHQTLKQVFREHGYEVNRDDQKGLGNKCLDEVTKAFKDYLTGWANEGQVIEILEFIRKIEKDMEA